MTNYYCIPICKTCRLTETCDKQTEYENRTITPSPIEWPDRLTGRYMECGHVVPVIPVVLGTLKPSAVWCDEHGWQPIPVKKRSSKEYPDVPLY